MPPPYRTAGSAGLRAKRNNHSRVSHQPRSVRSHLSDTLPAGDVNGDGPVNNADLLTVLFEYGTQGDTVADLNGNGVVEDSDLLTVLFEFGSSG